MVFAVRAVKAAPFSCSQWTKNWMVRDRLGRRETGFALGDDFIHARDVSHDLAGNLLGGSAARSNKIWRFPPFGKITHAGNEQSWPAHFGTIRTGARLSGRKAALQILNRPDVTEVEMLQDFTRAPFFGGMTGKFLRRHPLDCVRKYLLQFRQFAMHVV